MKKKLLTIATIITMTFAIGACGNNSTKTPVTESQTETEQSIWPTDGAAGKIPVFNKNSGSVNMNSSEYFWATVTDYSQDLFNDYVNELKNAGYTEEFMQYENWYSAKNKDGDYVDASYYDNKKEMSISLTVYSNQTEESEIESIGTETSDTEDTEEVSDDIRPEVKEALDSYESFMNDYADFMKKYNENPSDSELLSEYADYMSNYADTMDKINNLENDLNDAELKYYTEVQTRVLKVLSDAQ